jgi:type VI secretion system protein ImpA
VAAGNAAAPADGATPNLAHIDAAFQDTGLAEHEAAAGVVQSAGVHLATIEALFQREHAGHGPGLDALADVLRQATFAVVSRLERRHAALPPERGEAKAGGPAGVSPAHPAAGFNADIRTRADVLRALDKICEYYAEFEPSSPLPLLLRRGRRLVSKSFLDIIRDMAPDGVSQVESIAGKADA